MSDHVASGTGFACPYCGAEADLMDLARRATGRARCRACHAELERPTSVADGSRRRTTPERVVAAMLLALDAGDPVTAARLLDPGVRWWDPDIGREMTGRDEVRAGWRVDRRLVALAVHADDDGVTALVVDRSADELDARLVGWVVVVEGVQVLSVTLTVLAREIDLRDDAGVMRVTACEARP